MQPKYAISTRNGVFFDYHHPERYAFGIEEIAHALSHICRYGGHCDRFYSVAEHCVLVSQVVPPEFALCGLLHDASEAYVGDMPSPLKALCQSYRSIENRVQGALAAYYSLPYPFPPVIHLADKMLYKAERLQIAPVPDLVWYTGIPAADVVIHGYSPDVAKDLYLSRYDEIISQKETNEATQFSQSKESEHTA